VTDGVRPLDAGARPRRLAPDTLGFACGICFLLSSLSLLLHWYELKTPAAASAARVLGALTLFVAPLFPWLALASPEPANGPKLVVFPVAVMLALTPWVPRQWFTELGTGRIVSAILLFSVAGNLMVPFIPAAGSVNNIDKRIQWNAGGKLMGFAAAVGLTIAGADAVWERTPRAYAFASIALLPVFAYFVQTRFTTSPRAIVAGLTVASVGGVLFGFTENGLTGAALALGSFYCATHVARTASVLWTLLGGILAAGASRSLPSLVPGVFLGVMVLTGYAARARNWAAIPLCVLVMLACSLALTTRPVWTPRIPMFYQWCEAPSTAYACLAIAIAIAIVICGYIGMVRLRTPPVARAFFWVCFGWFPLGFMVSRDSLDCVPVSLMGFALLAACVVARRDEGVPWAPGSPAPLA
jgi:hypothetical protein